MRAWILKCGPGPTELSKLPFWTLQWLESILYLLMGFWLHFLWFIIRRVCPAMFRPQQCHGRAWYKALVQGVDIGRWPWGTRAGSRGGGLVPGKVEKGRQEAVPRALYWATYPVGNWISPSWGLFGHCVPRITGLFSSRRLPHPPIQGWSRVALGC